MADIRYNFVATGQPELLAAFKSVTAAARESQRAEVTAAREGAKANAIAAKQVERATAAKERADARTAAKATRDAEKAKAIAERSAAAQTKAAEKAAAAQTKATEKAAAAQAKAAEKAAAAKAKAEQKAAAEQIRAAEKVASARAKAEQKAEQVRAARAAARIRREDAELQKTVARYARMEVAEKKREARAAAKEASAMARAQQKVALQRERSMERYVGMGKSALIGGLVTGSAVATGLVGAAARDSARLDEATTRLAINARGSGEAMEDPRKLREEFEAVAISTPGIKAADVADAVGKFVSLTGDFDTARKSIKTFATVASATGSDIGEISEAAASLSNQLGIKDESAMQEVLSTLIAQGKGGAFELRDMASQFQTLAAAGAGFGIQQNAQGVRTLGGLVQVARSGTGSPEEASTTVQAILSQLKTESGRLTKAGVSVYDKSGKTRDLKEILIDTVTKVGGTNMEAKNAELTSIFGRQGIRGLSPLTGKFQQTLNETRGTNEQKLAAATNAVREALEKAIDAPGDWSDVQKEAAIAQKMTSAQLTRVWETLISKVGENFVPMVGDALGKLTEFLANTSAMDELVNVFEALAFSAGLVADAFVALGLIEKKNQTPQEKLQHAEKAVADFNTVLAKKGLNATPEDIAKRDQLQAAYDQAYSGAWQAPKKWTPEQFAEQYNAANPSRLDNHGDRVARRIAALQPEMSNDKAPMFWGENEDQKRIRHDYLGQVTYEHMSAQQGGVPPAKDQAIAQAVNTDETNKAIAALGVAAAQATAKLQQASQGSIVPP